MGRVSPRFPRPFASASPGLASAARLAIRVALLLVAVGFPPGSSDPASAADRPPLPTAHQTQTLEGWTVRVDQRLREGEHAPLGTRALRLLAARLVAITEVVPPPALAKLRQITIQLDHTHGELVPMQYHPSREWLTEHGYSPQLARCVHIPDVADFLEPQGIHNQPWVVLHELAHGFHDQVLGFDEPRVVAAWQKFRDSGRYRSVLTVSGRHREHYGLTNPQEFFAEMSESYFGSNDFHPFVAGELRQVEPAIFALLTDLWGPLPGFEQPAAKTARDQADE